MLHHYFAVQGAGEKRYDIWCNRGIDAAAAHMLALAKECFDRSLALQDTFEGHYNYGNLLSTVMDIDGAVEHYKAAVMLDPSNAQLHANLGVALIAQGKWREGFTAYRHRFHAPGFPSRPRFNYPPWQGEQLSGKTIMLYAEQGFGDEIMSLRFAKPVKDLGARVIVSVRPPMFRAARSLVEVAQVADAVILQYDPPPWEPDYMCALLDVPSRFDIVPENVPLKGGYLTAEDRGYRLSFPPGLNVGICWASGKRALQPTVHEIAKQKTLDFEQIAPLARPGVNLLSLQQNHSEHNKLEQLGINDPMEGVTDFEDTAWLIDQLDLVVTVDTSVAHLAGALGKPCWNLVRFDALWPWRKETKQTCWYDSMTIYRQERPFDWNEPLKRLMADFGEKVRCQAKAAA
jgi:hypothetical protein